MMYELTRQIVEVDTLRRTALTVGLLGIIAMLVLTPVRAQTPLDLSATGAGQAFRAGDFADALQGFRELAEAHPNDPVILRYLAITLDRLGEYEEAISIFRRVLVLAPESIATHYHLGVTYYKARLAEQSVSMFEQVLTQAQESQYAELAKAYLQAIADQRAKLARPGAPRRWGLFAQIAVQHDDNIPAAPDDPRFFQGEREGNRLGSYVGIDFNFLRNARWTGTAEVYGYASFYEDEFFEPFDTRQYGGSLSLQRTFKWGKTPGTWNLRVEGFTVDLNQESYSRTGQAKFIMSFRLADRTVTNIYASYTNDDFENDGFDPAISSRDADDYLAGLSLKQYFGAQQANIWVGLDAQENRAEGVNFQFDAWQARMGTQLPLFWKLQLDLSLIYREEDYPNFLGSVPRKNERLEVWLGLSRWFGKHFRARLSYAWRDEESTYESLTYDRNTWGLELSYVL